MGKEKKYVVVSLFNGMGCAWLALESAAIKVSQKISSEIDKHAIKVNDANYPETSQVGDVRKINVVHGKDGRPIRLETEKGNVDLLDDEIILCGGSPCQSFSFAGKRKGMSTKDEQEILTLDHYLKLKAEEYEFEGQSYLFWEFMRLKTELNPVYFLLENVVMSKKWKTVLSKAIGVNPVEINSSLVSAQNRERLYWTNILNESFGLFGDMECKIPQPKDRGILLKHILEKDVPQKYYLSEKAMKYLERSEVNRRFMQHWENDKANCVVANYHKGIPYNVIDVGEGATPHTDRAPGESDLFVVTDATCVAMRGRNPENPNDRTVGAPTEQRLEPRFDGKTNCLTTVSKDNLIIENGSYIQWQGNGFDQDRRAYYEDGKSGTIDCVPGRQKVLLNGDGASAKISSRIRKLTETECERLQCVPDFYTKHVSATQRYRMLGNGWNIDTIAHIFSFIGK